MKFSSLSVSSAAVALLSLYISSHDRNFGVQAFQQRGVANKPSVSYSSNIMNNPLAIEVPRSIEEYIPLWLVKPETRSQGTATAHCSSSVSSRSAATPIFQENQRKVDPVSVPPVASVAKASAVAAVAADLKLAEEEKKTPDLAKVAAVIEAVVEDDDDTHDDYFFSDDLISTFDFERGVDATTIQGAAMVSAVATLAMGCDIQEMAFASVLMSALTIAPGVPGTFARIVGDLGHDAFCACRDSLAPTLLDVLQQTAPKLAKTVRDVDVPSKARDAVEIILRLNLAAKMQDAMQTTRQHCQDLMMQQQQNVITTIKPKQRQPQANVARPRPHFIKSPQPMSSPRVVTPTDIESEITEKTIDLQDEGIPFFLADSASVLPPVTATDNVQDDIGFDDNSANTEPLVMKASSDNVAPTEITTKSNDQLHRSLLRYRLELEAKKLIVTKQPIAATEGMASQQLTSRLEQTKLDRSRQNEASMRALLAYRLAASTSTTVASSSTIPDNTEGSTLPELRNIQLDPIDTVSTDRSTDDRFQRSLLEARLAMEQRTQASSRGHAWDMDVDPTLQEMDLEDEFRVPQQPREGSAAVESIHAETGLDAAWWQERVQKQQRNRQ